MQVQAQRKRRTGWLWATVALAFVAMLLVLTVRMVSEPDAFTRALERGPLYAGLAAFLGGFATSLTPCVYPMIAITVSVFGARETRSRWQAMGLSTAFVLGIAAMFTPLGVVAGYTGAVFGTVLSSPWVVFGIAFVFLALAASMFGAFELVLPSGLTNRLAQVGGVGMGGAFLLGLVSGIIAAPCTGPVLTGILLWIGNTKSAGLGALAMGAFSLGLGIPFWLVGTFAIRLPKGGSWMVGVKSFFGIVLAVAALYYLKNAVPLLASLARPEALFAYGAAAVALFGLVLGAIHLSFDEGGWWIRLRKGAGILATVAGSFLLLSWWQMPKAQLAWELSETEARQRALVEKRPLLIDFTADWCGACNDLARETFAHPDVMEEAGRFVAVKVDATNDDDPAVVEVQERYRVVGLPTVLIFDSQGTERARITEFVPPAKFLEAIRDVE